MLLAGIVATFAGFLISILSLTLSSSVGGRMVIVLIGMIVSLFGIIGLINKAYLKDAIWKK
ncbi:MAG: hypothetical protein DMG58_32380 [Acidobacteria bacterium]|jgi:hypothetical protein|nr:MAG: hypothetical protein DMG58_32380 [Acidobacteriota bacterium]